MRTALKIISFLLGLTGIIVVVWLGFQTANNQSPQLVAIFGIASALVAPLGFALIGFAFTTKDQEVLVDLAKVPKIETLIKEAKSQEEKVRLLERQKKQLAQIVLFEARRHSLISRGETLEREGVRILDELRAIDAELATLDSTTTSDPEIIKELTNLRERIASRQRGDLVFVMGRRSFTLEADLVQSLPWGNLAYELLKVVSRFLEWATLEIKRISEKRNARNDI